MVVVILGLLVWFIFSLVLHNKWKLVFRDMVKYSEEKMDQREIELHDYLRPNNDLLEKILAAIEEQTTANDGHQSDNYMLLEGIEKSTDNASSTLDEIADHTGRSPYDWQKIDDETVEIERMNL